MNLHVARGEGFLKNCMFDGLAHSYDVAEQRYVKPYPEVTGYIIKYFCDQNQVILAWSCIVSFLMFVWGVGIGTY